ncbi:MAG: pyrimidine-nucleoside phosphorylase [Tissierellia bacterium]|nr:pyrimidine-nucleoside phosphorylase [Tissierellia bacterium]
MNMYDIISKKRDNEQLTEEEIKYFINAYVENRIPDYQISALLMAIYLNGMNSDETFYMTKAFLESGDAINLEKINGIKVDKHSTGGVGDKTTIVLGPMVAACGVPFAKMSGRGLGHTGGTLDKLESIPGFEVELTVEKFIEEVNNIGIAICSQTGKITPADKKIYALRDTTATVDSLPLIASSIMSKKLAVGADGIILDVKIGSGAFMKTKEEAAALSKIMIDLGERYNRKTMALITNMDQPLGYAIGNSLEVIEAINTLKGEGPKDLTDLVLNLGANLLIIAKKYDDKESAINKLKEVLENGSAYEKFKELVKNQNGNVEYIEDTSKFELSKNVIEVKSKKQGYVKSLDALAIGKLSQSLGAGRETMDTELDLGAGILLNKKIGDPVDENEILATLYTNKNGLGNIEDKILDVYEISEEKIDAPNIILGEVGHVE